jgi:Tfp pilus assembly protein PilN
MINLLPYTEKKFIKRIRFLRISNTVFAGIMGVLGVAALLLVPTLMTIDSRYNLVTNQMNTLVRDEKIVSASDVAALEAKAQFLEQKLTQKPQTTPLVYVASITERVPRGVTLTRLSLSNGTLVEVFGAAPNREILQSFIKQIESLESVERVDNPLSNLVKTKEGGFKITVQFKAS